MNNKSLTQILTDVEGAGLHFVVAHASDKKLVAQNFMYFKSRYLQKHRPEYMNCETHEDLINYAEREFEVLKRYTGAYLVIRS